MSGGVTWIDGEGGTDGAQAAPPEGLARLLPAILDGMGDGLIVADENGRLLFFNAAARRVLGAGPADAPPGDWPLLFGLYQPDTGALFDAHDLPLVRAVRGEPCDQVEVLVRNARAPEGVLLSVTGRPLLDAGGAPRGGVVVLRDVTARLRAEEELRRSRERFALAVEGSGDGLWDWDVARAEVYFSPRWKNMLGHADNEIGNHFEEWSNRLHPEDRRRALQTIDDYFNGRLAEYSLEHRLRHKDGSYRWILARGAAIRDTGGRISRMAGSHCDVTRRREQEEELRRSRDAAEQANRAKSEFLANVSHELRTPLNGVLGLTELTLDTPLTPEQRGNLQLVQASTLGLLGVIEDLLDFARIEAGKLDLAPAEFDPRDALGDALKALAPRAHAAGLELAYHVDAAVPDRLIGDWSRLRQVVVNLVGNAVKFTDAGEVFVSVGVASEGPKGETPFPDPSSLAARHSPLATLHFEVRDTGVGVPLEKQRAIFEPFVQADGSLTRRHGGAGLGLAISGRLVAAMGGRLWVESVPGCGSVFQFRVPLAAPPGAAPPPPTAEFEGMRILIVDDNACQRLALAAAVAAAGATAEAAGDVDAAAALLTRAGAGGNPFHAVLVDAGMVGSGRVERAAGGAVVLRLLTTRDRLLAPAPGLVKPVKPATLLAALRQDLAGTHTHAPSAPEPSPPRLCRPLRVLIAEDHPINQRLSAALVRKLGCSAVVARDGEEALAALRREPFDAVLMDLQMPRMDGFEATACIRAGEAGGGSRLPIIALTAHALNGDRERCLRAGMDGYLAKPVSPRALYLALADVAGRAVPPERPDPGTNPPMSESPPPSSGFNRAVALARVGGDEELLRELTEVYLKDAPGWLDDLRRAVARGDAAALRRAAHTIKGAVGYFGADDAGAAADRLQELGRAGDAAGAAVALPELEQALGRLGAALHALDRPPSLENQA